MRDSKNCCSGSKLLILLLLIVIVVTFGCNNGPKITTVGYLQITPDPVLDIAKDGLFKALEDSGFVDGNNFRLIEKNAQGDLSMIPMIIESFIAQNVDIIVTNSTPCMVAAAQMVKEIPVVFTVSFEPKAVGLKSIPANLYGVYDPLNEVKFVDLMFELIPGLKKVGLPFNNSEPNAEYSAKKFNAELVKRGVEVIETSVSSTNDILMAGQYLAGQNVDVILVAADNTMYMGLNALAKVASDARIPLFVTDPMHTDKGATFGFGVNYKQWGYLSGLKVIELLRGISIENDKKIEPIEQCELIINEAEAVSLGLQISDSLLKRASKVLNVIRH